MSITENGISTTRLNGQEQYETFTANGKKHYQYDYRHTNGKLFSCVAKTLADCRAKRDVWLASLQHDVFGVFMQEKIKDAKEFQMFLVDWGMSEDDAKKTVLAVIFDVKDCYSFKSDKTDIIHTLESIEKAIKNANHSD